MSRTHQGLGDDIQHCRGSVCVCVCESACIRMNKVSLWEHFLMCSYINGWPSRAMMLPSMRSPFTALKLILIIHGRRWAICWIVLNGTVPTTSKKKSKDPKWTVICTAVKGVQNILWSVHLKSHLEEVRNEYDHNVFAVLMLIRDVQRK